MASLTAIEFSSDTCVIVRTSVRGTTVDVRGVQVIDPAAYPGGGTLAATLRQARRAGHFARRARVVLWGMPEGAGPRDPAVHPRLEPLISAGFRIDRVVSACNALAALARSRVPRAEGAVIWLAVDRAGVAIIASYPGDLLYSHAFGWDSSVGASGSQAHLLHRYALVSFLAPEVRRAIAAAQEKGRRVEAIVTCGTLPDLRSLTMPLIEELDVEVETLDTLEGLKVNRSMQDRLTGMAAAIRIACAGAIARPTRLRGAAAAATASSSASVGRVIVSAAAAAIVLAGAWLFLPRLTQRTPSAPPVAAPASVPAPPPAAPTSTAKPPAPAVPGRVPPPPTPSAAHTPAGTPPAKAPTPVTTRPPAQAPAARPLTPAAPRADKPPAEPLKEPLPVINTILVSSTRRFATIDGRIVGIGDKVGQRTIVGIEPHFVVFREPSGVQIRVGLGGRRPADDRVSR
jgi:hypothetical protein